MADINKLKSRLGPPPSEASFNLTAPEVAPPAPRLQAGYIRRDGRAARRTHRTVGFATKVSPVWDNMLRDIADRDDLMLVEVLERALDAYEREHAAKLAAESKQDELSLQPER